MDLLKGKTAVVTGGGRGIGWGVSKLFAAEGGTVVMMGRNEKTLSKAEKAIARKGGRAVGIAGDISRFDDVRRVMEFTKREFGRIDILVANAGINPVTPFLEITEEEWDEVMNINLKGTFLCVQTAARTMVKQKSGGRIVIISSVDSNSVVPGEAHYGPAKAALIQLNRVAAVELAKRGVYVNCVAPGWVDTDLVKDELSKPDRKAFWTRDIPAKKIGTIEEIAQGVLFLSGDNVGKFTVGAVLSIDGGHSLLLHGMEV